MIPVTCMAGKSLAVFGLGGSGLATAKALIAGGAQVIAWDDDAPARDAAQAADIPVADLHDIDWSAIAALVLAPGVPLTHPAPHWSVGLARAANVEVIGDIELFCRQLKLLPPSMLIAITGTNGKSTTTALLAHVLLANGAPVEMGGNIGTPVLALAPPDGKRIYVLEVSSFQIDLAPSLAPTIGVLMNVTPDHLDRHGTFKDYAAIKERMVMASDLALIGVDDDTSLAIARKRGETGGKIACFSATRTLDTGFVAKIGKAGTKIIWRSSAGRIELADLMGHPALRGAHNAQNAAAACAVASALKLDPNSLAAAVATFPGLPHRLEEVGRRGNVLFINDSKATNADSTEKALTSFHDIFWIAGGRPKEGGIASLRRHFGRVAKAYLIGEAAEDFARALEGHVPFELCGTLDVAVAKAAADAARWTSREPVPVVLSPACASYDQYRNFAERGDHFRRLVAELPGV